MLTETIAKLSQKYNGETSKIVDALIKLAKKDHDLYYEIMVHCVKTCSDHHVEKFTYNKRKQIIKTIQSKEQILKSQALSDKEWRDTILEYSIYNGKFIGDCTKADIELSILNRRKTIKGHEVAIEIEEKFLQLAPETGTLREANLTEEQLRSVGL